MSDFRSERHGQNEIGFVAHQGREFAAGGASVNGRNVTGYTSRDKRGDVTLRTWSGQTMLGCRSDVVGKYKDRDGDDTYALVFSLTHSRFIVGYALGLDGMLFRGELVDKIDSDDAAAAAREVAVHWLLVDHEDSERCEEEENEGTVDLMVAYIGDGYLAAAMLASDSDEGMDFGYDLREEDGYEEARLHSVPANVADNLLRQGCSDQHYDDGYDAAQAAIPYLTD